MQITCLYIRTWSFFIASVEQDKQGRVDSLVCL